MIDQKIATENIQIIHLIQSMVGAISPNFRRVTVEVSESISLCFLLERDDSRDREEINDIVFEFEALQEGAVEVRVDVLVDRRPLSEIDLPGRAVFGRREA